MMTRYNTTNDMRTRWTRRSASVKGTTRSVLAAGALAGLLALGAHAPMSGQTAVAGRAPITLDGGHWHNPQAIGAGSHWHAGHEGAATDRYSTADGGHWHGV